MVVTAEQPRRSQIGRHTWSVDHPLLSALAITVLIGTALQLTHMIEFQERIAGIVGWDLRVRFIDFGFRNLMGALTLLLGIPFLFGHSRREQWFRPYLRDLRLTAGEDPRLTAAAGLASATTLVLLVAGLAAVLGELRIDPGFWLEDSRWFIVILSLVPGIWEELAFRGLMLSNLQQRYHRWVAIVVTGVLFGLMHVTNLLLRQPQDVVFEVMMATAVGIAWGYLTVKTGSVVPAMCMHFLINVSIGLLLDPVLSPAASAVIFGSLTIAYPIITILAVWWLAKRAELQSPDRESGGTRVKVGEIAAPPAS